MLSVNSVKHNGLTKTVQKLDTNAGVICGIAAMAAVITASNILVQYPINDWLTWGHFSFPVTFLVADVINRRLGASKARSVAYVGFFVAIVLSYWLASPRIALASGIAFITGQLTNIGIFSALRYRNWWHAPLISSTIASTIDTALFYAIAFAGTGLPWVTWALGDYGVKIVCAVFLLLPFFLITNRLWTGADSSANS